MSKSIAIRHAVHCVLISSAIACGAPAFAADTGAVPETVVVTGSIIRRTDIETPSPITVVSAEELEQRGINTIADAVQRLTANNAGTITQGWNTGFNFASGANAPALRGLTVQATLSVADGLRLAQYPLQDDGQRGFVDLNAIPSAIVERVEVLRDGASSTYGADAIAGVVNVITKKEVQGLHVGGSTGLAEGGGGTERHIDMTWGTGSLVNDGYNFYVSGEFQTQDTLWARDRGYPFNTLDWTRECGASGSCLNNRTWNGVTAEDGSFNGLISIPGVSLVRPVAAGAAVGAGRYQFLNAAAGCRNWQTITITAAQAGTASPLTICNVDQQAAYIQLSPEIQRSGVSMRFTKNVSDQAQFYAMANYYKTVTDANFTPIGFNGALPPPNPAGLAAANVILPVYVCSTGVGTFDGQNTGCTAANGSLNPNNPFAAAGQRAQLFLRNPYGREVQTFSRALRGVAGLDGEFGDKWTYSANLTTSEVSLERDQSHFLIPQRVWDAAAQGTFNFSDPLATPKQVWDYISPVSSVTSTSRLWQVQATIGKELFQLPGGGFAVAAGGSYREESINSPSSNPANTSAPYTRFLSVNAVGTAGSRTVQSGFFEISAPVFKMLELQGSGRYDKYSTGQSNFSPKLGFKFSPIEMVALRGTWSQGFRIPSFAEAFGLPTTGFVSRTVNCTTFPAFCAAHGGNAYATGQYNLGLTQVGNAALNPEESESFTAGVVFEPFRGFNLTVDYWHIKVDNLISGVTNTAPVEQAYYANNGVVNIPGFIVTPGTPDPAFPNALPTLGFIQTSYANQDSEVVSGIDFGANYTMPIGPLTWRSGVDVSYLKQYVLTSAAGDVFHYEGTLSPCNVTSCSGAPQWRATWQNTAEFDTSLGHTAVTLTAYYTSGYDTASTDLNGIAGDCQTNADNGASTQAYVDGTPANCKTKPVWNFDLVTRHKINDTYTVSLDVLNVFDIKPKFDPAAAYSLFGYNPAWGGQNMLGRFFRLGIKADF